MLYFVSTAYVPNTAVSNRLKGYYSALENRGVNATIVYLYPDANLSRHSEVYKYLNIVYLWDKGSYKGKMSRIFFSLWNIIRFYKMLKHGDIVYTYGINRLTQAALYKKGVKVYAERTEYLAVSLKGPATLTKKQVIQVAKKLDGLFVISTSLKNLFVRHGVDENRIEIINMIVDSSRFIDIHKINTGHKYIAYCGTISNNKDGVDLLIKSFAIISKQFPDVYLYIIGEMTSSNDAKQNLNLIDSLGIKEKVIITGKLTSDAMPQILKNATVLALCRPNNEQATYGFPTKLGEYLLTENPVVITKVGDIPLFLSDGKTALLAEPNNIEDFADKVEWALNNMFEASIIGINGSMVAKEAFNNEIETSKILNFMGLN